MGSAGRIERVYFEIKQSHIDQWEKPQIKVNLKSDAFEFYSIISIFISRHAVGPGTGDIAMPPIRLSICLSVTFSFCTVTRKHIDVFSGKLCMYVYHAMGVCCIVFDIDGMLFEFVMNFVNIETIKF